MMKLGAVKAREAHHHEWPYERVAMELMNRDEARCSEGERRLSRERSCLEGEVPTCTALLGQKTQRVLALPRAGGLAVPRMARIRAHASHAYPLFTTVLKWSYDHLASLTLMGRGGERWPQKWSSDHFGIKEIPVVTM